jgi:hypothetical protein
MEGRKMNKTWKLLLAAVAVCVGTATFAAPPRHHKHNEGLEIANGIVDMLLKVTNPAYAAAQHHRHYHKPVPPPPPKRYRRPAPPKRVHKPAPPQKGRQPANNNRRGNTGRRR